MLIRTILNSIQIHVGGSSHQLGGQIRWSEFWHRSPCKTFWEPQELVSKTLSRLDWQRYHLQHGKGSCAWDIQILYLNSACQIERGNTSRLRCLPGSRPSRTCSADSIDTLFLNGHGANTEPRCRGSCLSTWSWGRVVSPCWKYEASSDPLMRRIVVARPRRRNPHDDLSPSDMLSELDDSGRQIGTSEGTCLSGFGYVKISPHRLQSFCKPPCRLSQARIQFGSTIIVMQPQTLIRKRWNHNISLPLFLS